LTGAKSNHKPLFDSDWHFTLGGTCGISVYNGEIYNALYIYRFEIMILLRVKAKSLLCCGSNGEREK